MANLNIRFEAKLTSRAARWLVVGACLCLMALVVSPEDITLDTYYPAPTGVYTNMITTQQTILARDSGNVGIGTAQPQAKLDVVGNVRIADGTQVAGHVLTSDANGVASWQPLSVGALSDYSASCGGCGGSPCGWQSIGAHSFCVLSHTQSVSWQYGLCQVSHDAASPPNWKMQAWCAQCGAVCFGSGAGGGGGGGGGGCPPGGMPSCRFFPGSHPFCCPGGGPWICAPAQSCP